MSSPETFLITGCASGIGRHLAETFVKQGRKVLLTDVAADRLEEVYKNLDPNRCAMLPLDVREADQWEAAVRFAVEQWGTLDAVLNVAGYLRVGELLDIPDAEVHRHLDINSKGVILGTLAAARQMKRQGGGRIVNIASLAGIAPVPGLALYCASKFAVRGFSLSAALEFKPHGIAVTVVCPDAVQTPMLDIQKNREEAALTFTGGRILTVADIAEAVERALRKGPMEIVVPRQRGWLAKLTSAVPGITGTLLERLKQRGRERQKKIRGTAA
jgi:3-oxoacyl-[acyl-carrier protein] reductase